MAKNKIITSQGNVQFINSKGKTISMHPMHCYAVYQDDTVSFLFIYMKEYSGQAFFASQFEDLEVDGETYDSIDALKEAIAEAFAKAGAQARTEIVDELPETGYTNTIYLIKKEHGEGYDEYIYNEEKGWQLIGDTDIEFERYLQKDDFNEYSADTKEKIDYISGAVDDNASDIQFLSGAVDTEISDREAADAVISGAVDTLSTNLSNEVQRAQNAEQTLQNNINTVNSRVDAEQIARANADNALSGAIDSVTSDLASEVSRAEGVETALSGAIDTEISAREAADSVISGAVDSLSADLSLEAQRAQNAESALNTKVNALSGAIDSVDDKIETLSGEVETMGDEAIVDAEYVSSSTTIDFYNASGDVVSQIDATPFITDGMIDDVRIETISGVTYLVIDFNTASGKEDIKIPLTDIFNPDNYYDKTAVDGFVSDLEAADSVISGAVDNVSSDLATESQRAQNAEGVLSGAIDTKLAISDFNTYSGTVETALNSKANSADVYSKSEVYTKAEVDEAIAEIDLSDYYNKTEVDGKLADKADLSALTEDERVWGEALNDLNSRINTVSGDVADKVDTTTYNAYTANTQTAINAKANSADVYTKSEVDTALGGKQDTLSAGTGIDITDNVISVTGGGGGESCTVEETTIYDTTNTNYYDYNGDNKLEYIIVDYQGDKTTMTNNFYLIVGDASNDYAQGYIYFDYPNHSASTEGDTALTEYFDVEYISDINDFKVSVASTYQSTCWIKSIQNLFITNIEIPYYTINSGSPCTVISNDIVELIGKVKKVADGSVSVATITSSTNKISLNSVSNTGLSSLSNINLEELDGTNNTLKPNIKIGLGTSGWNEITLSDNCNINDIYTNKVRVTYDYETFDANQMYISIVAIDNYNNSHYDNIQFDQMTEQPTFYSNDSYATAVTVTWSASTKELVFEYPATYEDGGETKTLKIKDMGSQNCQYGYTITKVETYGEIKQDIKSYVQETKAALGGLSLVKLTRAEYDALVTKDSNTLYIISD